jgi:hypothetical protein
MTSTPQEPDPDIVPGTSRPIPVDPDTTVPPDENDPAQVVGPD